MASGPLEIESAGAGPCVGPGLHVAVIMDGNGRWAGDRGLGRIEGHRAGADAVRRTVEAAPRLGIGVLTLFAFSCDNWKRPPAEVTSLMRLLRSYLRAEAGNCVRHGIRLLAIGRRDRLPRSLVAEIARAEEATSRCDALVLRLAIDYSARIVLLRAARLTDGAEVTAERFQALLARAEHGIPVPPVDLLIRTGGEQRLSDFLLWESAYAELVFTPTMWPDFTGADLGTALSEFHRRQRRFGGLPRAVAR